MCYFILDPIVINESIGKCVFLTMWCLGGRMRDSIFGVEKQKDELQLLEACCSYCVSTLFMQDQKGWNSQVGRDSTVRDRHFEK